MGLPNEPVTLTPEQVAEINRQLADCRHAINNHLALVVAAVELIRFKPEMSGKMVHTISDQPAKIMTEIRGFSTQFETLLHITKDAPPGSTPS